jgi:hypothetical protein
MFYVKALFTGRDSDGFISFPLLLEAVSVNEFQSETLEALIPFLCSLRLSRK